VTAGVFFGIGFPVNNKNVSLTLNFAISVFVAWVPEGLPATVTILLTISAKRMAARNVLVKDLQGVETLGAITLLATDKTGTLTRNQMTVTYVWSCLTMKNAMDKSVQPPIVESPGVVDIMNICTLNSRAKFDRTDVPVSQRQILGDATETGLVRFAGEGFGTKFDTIPDEYPKVFEIPFNSDNKWAMTIHKKQHAQGPLTLCVKGAPERVLNLCTNILLEDGSSVPLSEEHLAAFQETYSYMAGQGHRVLAFAQDLLPESEYPADFVFDKTTKNYPMSGMTFVGLVSLEDPPKHGVREAIGKCRAAGIKVMMVTGDHPLTAEAIGRKINLMVGDTKDLAAKRLQCAEEDVPENEYNSIVIHGDTIDGLSDEDWDTIFSKDEIIFARTSPKHKLEIVKRAQSMRHIVGVTGDGVNDAPALKKADLGIAMNISGSDVSKDAASMILLDDNFASIVHGIEEGRLIFVNLKKSIQYTITHSMPEVIPNLLYIIVPLPIPLSAILILVIDLGFELFAALTFAWDIPESEDGLMKMPPRKPVNPESIDRYRRHLIRREQYVQYNEEGEEVKPNIFRRYSNNIHELFSAAYWKEKFERSDDEVLVDFPLLSWAYLEIGLIEALGNMTCYFVVLWYNGITPYDAVIMQKGAVSPTNYFSNGPLYALDYTTIAGKVLNAEMQKRALGQAQSIVYWSIMVMQMFNMFACKTRFTMPIGRYMFSNKYTFAGIFGGASLATLIVYCPPFNIPFGTEWHLLPLWWLIAFGFGFIIIAYACLRIKVRQRFGRVKFNPDIHGLKMYPTIRTLATTDARSVNKMA
jgi:sodium/potassium-transporting ATPase subunit alpha